MMLSNQTEWGRGNINVYSYFINAARCLLCPISICLICSNIYLKKKQQYLLNLYFFDEFECDNSLIISPTEFMLLVSF